HAGGARHVELLRDAGELGHAHLLERGQIDHLGPFGLGGRRLLSSLAISVHRSFSPSPVAAETSSTGTVNARSNACCARERSARDSLSHLVATTPVGTPRAASQAWAWRSLSSPGCRLSTSSSTAKAPGRRRPAAPGAVRSLK